jgi:PAS domain S-box-containing protein
VHPVYSASGFDLLPILARVVNRPNPKINLGPVDLTCSFVVVDVRRYDSPIVYCSPTFCRLTGYEEQQVLGRNCRFLQSPIGSMEKGGQRLHDADAVAHLKKCLIANKECQTTLVNYKKDGRSFVNHITIIPVMGKVSDSSHEPDQVVYHVGFQTDMTEVSNTFMQKLRDGSLNVSYNTSHIPLTMGLPGRDRKSHALRISPMSKILSSLLTQTRFLQSIPITSGTTAPCSTSSDKMESPEINQILNLILLESLPDFIHVVSLKGSFLYVAPSVRNVLGYEPEELVGKSIAEFCHHADLIPLMRELKESSVTQGQVQDTQSRYPSSPKSIDILFRARTKAGDYVWVESRGRLHVEPGKGRKAIVLSGRSRGMPHLTWESIARTGGLTPATPAVGWPGLQRLEREFWGLLSSDGTILVVGAGIRDVLGWEADEVIGKAVDFLVVGNNEVLQVNMSRASEQGSCETSHLLFLRTKKGSHVSGKVVLYPSFDRVPSVSSPCQVICQIKLVDSSVLSPRFVTRFAHPLSASVFEELETSRSSSWQYELERLRFENQRLAEEIEVLEKKQFGMVPPTPLTSAFLDQRCHPSSSSPSSSMHHVRLESQDNTPPRRMSTSLKRSWDSRDVFPS